MARKQTENNPPLLDLIRQIAAGEILQAKRILETSPALATQAMSIGATRQTANSYWLPEIMHYVYAGDTALHIAAAGYRRALAKELLKRGADVLAKNRHGDQPLHYAISGGPGLITWNPKEQVSTLLYLIEAGADPNEANKRGVTPLHVAVRNRCPDAVAALLENGANPRSKSKAGSTPLAMAKHNTGRGGTGTPEAKTNQEKIIRLLEGKI